MWHMLVLQTDWKDTDVEDVRLHKGVLDYRIRMVLEYRFLSYKPHEV